MEVDEKTLGKIITAAVAALPNEKREYILGYAEGVLAMAERQRANVRQDSA